MPRLTARREEEEEEGEKSHIIRNGINDIEAQSRNDLISNFQF